MRKDTTVIISPLCIVCDTKVDARVVEQAYKIVQADSTVVRVDLRCGKCEAEKQRSYYER